MSICLVFIFGVCRILSLDSDPKCGHSSVQDRAHRLHRQFLQNQHLAPAQQGSIHLEGWILSGCANQSDCATLHMWKEGVLQTQTHTDLSETNFTQKGSGPILVSIRHCCYITVTHNTGFHRMLEFKASVFRINTV